VAVGVLGRVRDGVVQRLVHEGHITALLGHEGQRRGHVAADGITHAGQTGGIQPFLLDEHHRGIRPDGQLAHQAVVGAGIADDPAAAVHVEDDRQRALAADGFDDAYPHIAHVGG
jgi:hypothetical protein